MSIITFRISLIDEEKIFYSIPQSGREKKEGRKEGGSESEIERGCKCIIEFQSIII